jgi:DNA-binding CsgD family transcriptional regulator
MPVRERTGAAFIGRWAELALWADLLDRLPGAGGLLALLGEPGIGKSRLQQILNAKAAETGLRVLHVRCRESDAVSAYRPLIEALAPLARPGGPLAGEAGQGYGKALATVRRLWEGAVPGDPEDAPLTVAESTVRVLSLLAGGHGLVLAVDDVQWADPDTFVVLEHLARTVDVAPIVVTVTARADAAGKARVGGMAGTPAARVAELGRLDRADQEAMIVSLLGPDAPAEVVDFVAVRAEGLPLAVEELLSDLLRNGAVHRDHGAWTVHPERFEHASAASTDAAVEARLAEVDADATAVAVAVALRDDDSTWDEIAEITGQPADRVAAGLKELARADLLVPAGRGRFRYRHGLILDAVLAAANPSVVQRLAHQAAVSLERVAAADPALLARVARLWERSGDLDVASRSHAEAARQWVARGAAATAVVSARAALASAVSASPRAAAVDALSEALTRTGRFAEALALTDDVLTGDAAPTGAQAAAVHCRAARCAIETRQPAAAHRHLDAAERAGGLPHEVCALRATLAFEAGDAAEAAVLAARAVALAESAGHPAALGSALLVQARVLRSRDPADALPGLERLVELATAHALPTLYERAMLELGLVDRLTTNRADRLLEAHRLAEERGALHTQAVAELNVWPVLAERGDLDEAERMCRNSIEISRRYGLRTVLPAEAMLVLHEAMRGRFDSATAQAGRLRGSAFAGVAAFYLEVFCGAPERALAAIAPSAAVLSHAPDARAAPARGLHALLAAVVDDDIEPARLVSGTGIGARYNRGFVRLAEAVVAGARGDRAVADAAAADGFADFSPFPGMSALAAALAAQRAVRDGWGQPASWLGAAREHFEFLGNEAMRRRCDALLRAGGFPVPRRGRGDAEVPARLRRLGITSREMDVLLLVAERLTNAQIAERLTLSPRTVDTHVSRLIAKAQVSGRSELAALLS